MILPKNMILRVTKSDRFSHSCGRSAENVKALLIALCSLTSPVTNRRTNDHHRCNLSVPSDLEIPHNMAGSEIGIYERVVYDIVGIVVQIIQG